MTTGRDALLRPACCKRAKDERDVNSRPREVRQQLSEDIPNDAPGSDLRSENETEQLAGWDG